ncbi:MAG: hypothetical protein GY859_18410 [Desulfobacterales bacterium]|nr:hypothetical protein [Desulfobacterales bacterium]
MKRPVQLFTTLFIIALTSMATGFDELPTVTPIDTPDIVAMSYTLDVTIGFTQGSVVSNPAGIDCTSDGTTQSGDCQASFAAGSVVALQATAPPPDDEGNTYFFINWDDDPANTIPVYGFTMDGPKTVTANFAYLVPPAYLEAPPSTTEIIGPYLPVSEPIIYGTASEMRPIAIVARGDGGVDLNVGLISFGDGSAGVDVYAALSVDSVPDFFLFDSTGGLASISGGLVPWKTNVYGDVIDETLLEIPGALMPFLPAGVYHVHLMVTPAGSTSFYYYWTTYFEKLDFMINPFLIP